MPKKKPKQLILESSMAFQLFGLFAATEASQEEEAKEIIDAYFKDSLRPKNTWNGVNHQGAKRRIRGDAFLSPPLPTRYQQPKY